jgi:hypothetical protein
MSDRKKSSIKDRTKTVNRSSRSKQSPPKSKPLIAINILTNKPIGVLEWLELDDNENIIFEIVSKSKSQKLALKRCYFENFCGNNVYLLSEKIDNELDIVSIVDKYNKNEVYLSLKDFSKLDININYSIIKDFLDTENKICVLEIKDESDEFLNYHTLIFELEKYKNTHFAKKSIKYTNSDTEEMRVNQACNRWSFRWDIAVNGFLLHGENFFRRKFFYDSAIDKHYFYYNDHLEFIDVTEENKRKVIGRARFNVKRQLAYLDIAFTRNSKINSSNMKDNYYRGMTNFYKINPNQPDRQLEIGDVFYVKTFTSTTSSIDVAIKFARSGGSKGYLYKIEPQIGTPYSSVRGAIKGEHETLFPRNLIFKLERIEEGNTESYDIYVLSIKTISDSQFLENNGNIESYMTNCTTKSTI